MRLLSPALSVRRANVGVPAGAIEATALEAILGERPTNASDIFLLGALAYEMQTSGPPHGRGFLLTLQRQEAVRNRDLEILLV